jgi:hypothetical protein
MERGSSAGTTSVTNREEADVTGNVLLVGANDRLSTALERLMDGPAVRTASCVADTEGLRTDVVVIAADHPFEELTQVRVHPYLFSRPVVLLAPGHDVDMDEWRHEDVWVVTSTGFDQLEDLVDRVGRVLSKLHHPSRTAAARSAA